VQLRFTDDIEVKQNLHIIARERGKIVAQRDGHNIWVDLGREWLARLIGYASLGPDVPEEDFRVKYMGFGIGGTRQLAPATANSPPISPPYTGSNLQTDIDPTVVRLERPVRISAAAWIGQVQFPPDHDSVFHTTFHRLFTQSEVSYGSFLTVPLSEVGLFTADADPGVGDNTLIAYDTFDTISKTTSVEIEVVWTIRF